LARPEGKYVAIDGKAVRAACEKVYRKKAPVLINALMVETGICIGQLKLDDAVQNMSVRAKQVYFRNNPDAVCRLIFEVVPGAKM
jgi:hypothetical protein